jgi:hypothetical protein
MHEPRGIFPIAGLFFAGFMHSMIVTWVSRI